MTEPAVARLRTWSLRLAILGFAALVLAQTIVPSPALFVAAAGVVALGLVGFCAALVLRGRAASAPPS